MADSPGPCVKASTHSSIHPFFFHLSFHLLSHPSIGPHPPIPPPSVSSIRPSLPVPLLFFSLRPFHVIFLWLGLKSLLTSASLHFFFSSHLLFLSQRILIGPIVSVPRGPLTTGTTAVVHLMVRPQVVRAFDSSGVNTSQIESMWKSVSVIKEQIAVLELSEWITQWHCVTGNELTDIFDTPLIIIAEMFLVPDSQLWSFSVFLSLSRQLT